ncbi:hypothetical protein DENSPDRAFT_479164 [Dentipellis sp. KUC8613]|nr:hypothetical protein DENSPDRAFT_479164 [Dentipellis sp. KUC8613]
MRDSPLTLRVRKSRLFWLVHEPPLSTLLSGLLHDERNDARAGSPPTYAMGGFVPASAPGRRSMRSMRFLRVTYSTIAPRTSDRKPSTERIAITAIVDDASLVLLPLSAPEDVDGDPVDDGPPTVDDPVPDPELELGPEPEADADGFKPEVDGLDEGEPEPEVDVGLEPDEDDGGAPEPVGAPDDAGDEPEGAPAEVGVWDPTGLLEDGPPLIGPDGVGVLDAEPGAPETDAGD